MDRPVLWRLVLGVAVVGGGCALVVGVLLGGWWPPGAPVGSRDSASSAASAAPGPTEGSEVTLLQVQGAEREVVSYALGGTVVDRRTGAPLPDVRIEVRGGGREWSAVATTDTEGVFATVVDGTGLLPPGRTPAGAGPALDVRLSLPGYGARTVRDWPLPAGGEDQPPVRLDGEDHDDPAHDLGLRRVE